jgi:hypothetical protein
MRSYVIEKLHAKNGEETLRATLEDGRSVFLHSSYDPGGEAECWAQEVEYESGKTIVLFGLGLGYHLKALVSLLGPEVNILVIEPSDQIRALAEDIDETSSVLQLPNVSVSRDWTSFREAFDQTGGYWQDTILLKLPAYQQVFSEEYRSFVSKLHLQINSVLGNLCTLLTSSQKWQENCLRNLRHLGDSSPIAAAFNQFNGKPLIIVSAGPSLSKNIDLLSSAKGKAYILAVGTVNRLLVTKGIVPDLVASVDGMGGNYRHHFREVPSENLCLLYDPAVHHMVVSQHSGPKSLMLINPGNGWIERHTSTEIGQVQMGPSIANTAFDLACKLGADPIIFIGQDLAFTNDATHAEGTHVNGLRGFDYDISNPVHKLDTNPDATERKSLRKLLRVDGLNGEKVQTDNKMLTYLHWFEERIAALGGTRTVINATEGGALIRGTTPLTLQEALSRFCQEDISDSIQHITNILSQKPDYDISGFVNYLKTVRKCARRLGTQCKKGARLSKVLKEHHRGTKTCDLPAILERLNRIDQTLVREEQNYLPLHYLTAPILGLLSGRAKKSDDQEEVCHYSYLLYLELYRAFTGSLPLLKELIKTLDTDRKDYTPINRVRPEVGAQLSQM